jgi:ubiquinone/menaquinone biosynthesis C-methylase UbiE
MSISSTPKVVLDWGCGRRKHPGAIGMDNAPLAGVDVVHDLLSIPYPFPNDSADGIILSHVLEHFAFADMQVILSEAERILKPEGWVTISVPHALSPAYYSDPTHISRFNFETFFYFAEGHVFSYYASLQTCWRITRLWASVNLINNKFGLVAPVWQRLEHVCSRALSYVVRHSKTHTLPDLLVKQLPLWLVSIHCQMQKVERASAT